MFYAFVALLFFVEGAWSQEVSVTSHYPQTAFIAGRLLPFSVTSNSEVRVEQVAITEGILCGAQVDPFYPNIFQIQCSSPANVQVEIEYTVDGNRRATTSPIFTIKQNGTPRVESEEEP